MRRGWIALWMTLAGADGCGLGGRFACEQASECVAGGIEGTCQPDGFCSFPAGDCPSGQRYGEHSGELAGQCVPPSTGTSGAGTDASTTATDPTVDPTGSQTTSDPEPTSTTSGVATLPTTEPATETSVATSTTSQGSSTSSDGSTGEPLDPDLVLWFELEDFVDGIAQDSSSYAHDGACEGEQCPTTTMGIIANAASFDGVDDVIAVPPAAHLLTDEGLTVACWMRIESLPAEHQGLVTQALDVGNFNTFELYFTSSGDGRLRFSMADSETTDATVSYPDPLPLGDWIHVAATWDGQTLTAWMDGVAISEAPHTTYLESAKPILLGADDDNIASGQLEAFFEGQLDDVRVYARPLSAAEIDALASMR